MIAGVSRRPDCCSTAPRTGTRGLQRYLITAVLVRLADEGARVGLVLLALERTKSAAVGGLLVAVLLVPQVVAAPAIGLLTDRARQPRWVLTISVAGFAASLAAVAFLLGRVPLPVVVVRSCRSAELDSVDLRCQRPATRQGARRLGAQESGSAYQNP